MDTDDRVREYVAHVVSGCSADRINALSRFESGERHAVYRVSYVDPDGRPDEVVVRIAFGDDAAEGVQAEREARVLQKVQGVAAPLLYDFRRHSRWFPTPTMCMQFVRGQHRDMGTASPSDIEHLGTVVGRVHALPIDDLADLSPTTDANTTYLDWRLENDARKLPAVRDPLPAAMQRRLIRAWTVVNEVVESVRSRNRFATDEALALLHGDVAADNIIWGAEPVLIDWEYARLGDPADEIAYIFGQNGLTPNQRDAFWRGYGRWQPPLRLQELVERVGWWEPINLLGSVLWWVERWSQRAIADAAGHVDPSAPKPQDHYVNEAIERLTRLEQLLVASPPR